MPVADSIDNTTASAVHSRLNRAFGLDLLLYISIVTSMQISSKQCALRPWSSLVYQSFLDYFILPILLSLGLEPEVLIHRLCFGWPSPNNSLIRVTRRTQAAVRRTTYLFSLS